MTLNIGAVRLGLLGIGLLAFTGFGCATSEPDAAGTAKKTAESTKTATESEAKSMASNGGGLLDPSSSEMRQKAPDTVKVKFETTKGDFIVQLNRSWASRGVDRVYNLVKAGYYDDVRFFRVLDGFMAQFGISGDPKLNTIWSQQNILDDPVRGSNTRGMVTFAKSSAPNSRSTQLFINYGDNAGSLDGQGFAPVGEVIEGMDVVDGLYGGYGEGAPRGKGPAQGRLQSQGNAYLEAEFPDLDYIKKATIME